MATNAIVRPAFFSPGYGDNHRVASVVPLPNESFSEGTLSFRLLVFRWMSGFCSSTVYDRREICCPPPSDGVYQGEGTVLNHSWWWWIKCSTREIQNYARTLTPMSFVRQHFDLGYALLRNAICLCRRCRSSSAARLFHGQHYRLKPLRRSRCRTIYPRPAPPRHRRH